jgi:hypothetical protein
LNGRDQIGGMLWRRVDLPGHEAVRLFAGADGWQLEGTAVFGYDGAPSCLSYRIECGPEWETEAAVISGWIGNRAVAVEIDVDSARRWLVRGVEAVAVAGCTDIDLAFSPSTNLLPIRRLSLAPGHGSDVRAAWLRFPEFTLEPLDQRYSRLDEATYRYESAGGSFVRTLRTNPAGFVVSYPGLWEAVEP